MKRTQATTEHTHASHELGLMSQPAVWLCAIAGALVMATSAHAATDPDSLTVPSGSASMSAKAAYDHDTAYCKSSEVTENRALCMKEASRAFQEAKAGRIEPTDGTQTASHHMMKKHTAKAMSDSSTPGQDATSTSGTGQTSQPAGDK